MTDIPDSFNPQTLRAELNRRVTQRRDADRNVPISEDARGLLLHLAMTRGWIETRADLLSDSDLAALFSEAKHLAYILKNAQRQ